MTLKNNQLCNNCFSQILLPLKKEEVQV